MMKLHFAVIRGKDSTSLGLYLVVKLETLISFYFFSTVRLLKVARLY